MRANRFVGNAAAVLAASLFLNSCATNPVTGRREISLVSESQEIQMGKEYSAEVVQSIGLVNNPSLQSYVKGLGAALAAKSERPGLPWEFHVVDDAAVNAFAIPGGFIFVTRGLLAHTMNEAQLVSVLGHEIGHVTAKHSVQQISRTQLAQLGLGIGSILSPTVAQFGQIASAGLGMLFLKFGRDDELQADDLGFKYSLAQNYDVRENAKVFEMLQAQAELAGGGRLPEWQSTHPDPGNRIKRIMDRVATVTDNLSDNKVGAQEFLTRIDGLVFGENPRLGFFEGTVFKHPDLKFQIEFPTGWQTQNQPSAVIAVSQNQDAIAELSIAQGSAAAAAQQFFGQQGLQSSAPTRGSLNGNTAVSAEFSATTESNGTVRGVGTFVEYGGSTYRVLSYTLADRYSQYLSAFQRVHGSFNRLTDQRALAIQPMRIKLERVPRAMTLTEFNQQYPSVIPINQLAIANGMAPATSLSSGQLVKRVVR